MKSRLVSVTGATGFLGPHIVEAFRRQGWHVRAIVRPGGARPAPPGAEVREAPLVARPLAAALAGSDAVVHAAGLTRGRDALTLDRVNVEGTQAVVEAANECGARLVHVSSQAAIGTGTIGRPAREDDVPRPVTAYGRSKLAGEAVVGDRATVPWVIVRPAAVYGPGDRQFLPLAKLARRGLFPKVGPPSFALTIVYVEDVARAIALVAEHGAADGQSLFIGHPVPETPESVLRAMAVQIGRAYRPRRVATGWLRALARFGDVGWRLGYEPMLDSDRLSELTAEGFVCAIDRARDAAGFVATVPFEEGIARTVRWYRERGWL